MRDEAPVHPGTIAAPGLARTIAGSSADRASGAGTDPSSRVHGHPRTRAFNLRYEQEPWPKIAFTDIKDHQKAAA